MIQLTVRALFGESQVKEYRYELDQPVVTIGRLRENHIQLPLSTVSGSHAQITREAGHYFLIDRGSVNGTYLNGQRLQPEERKDIKNGDVIRIQSFELVFSADTSVGSNDPLTTSQIARRMVMEVLGSFESAAQEKPKLIMMGGAESGKQIPLQDAGKALLLGRDDGCDVVIKHPTISRKHAEISYTHNGAYLRDLNSVNGVYCNDQRIQGSQRLHDRDEIRLAQHNRPVPVRLVFCNPAEALLSQIEDVQHTPIGPPGHEPLARPKTTGDETAVISPSTPAAEQSAIPEQSTPPTPTPSLRPPVKPEVAAVAKEVQNVEMMGPPPMKTVIQGRIPLSGDTISIVKKPEPKKKSSKKLTVVLVLTILILVALVVFLYLRVY